jgi:putative SOS response-associated peptidase YedK
MCGRFVVASSPDILADRFKVDEVALDEHAPDYNVTPRAMVPIVRDRPARHDREQARVLSLVRWGLVPSWAKDPKLGDRLINARSETVATTNSYQAAFRRRRCIIPADAFYEWLKIEVPGRRQPVRQPWLVHRRDGEPMAFAGLWEIWRDRTIADDDDPDGWLRTCTIITTKANPLLARVHERMPVVLDESTWDQWLDPKFRDLDTLESFLVTAPDEWFDTYEVSQRVNSPKNNDADLLEPVGA